MHRFKILIVSIVMAAISGCNYLPSLDQVLPDKRTEYRSARDLPPLEVPPDLTTDTISEGMAIPGEESPNTLSAYEQQQRRSASGSELGALENEDSLTVRGDRFATWPELSRFWEERGYDLELDDAELGVLETDWSEPRSTADGEARDRFRVFAEPGDQENTTVLFISHDLQRRSGPGDEWLDAGSNTEKRKETVVALYEFFGGKPAATGDTRIASSEGASPSATTRRDSNLPRAEIINTEQGQVYISLPNEFDVAWRTTENAMVRAGMQIRASDRDKGEFVVAYKPPENEADKGWFDSLKFWQGDDATVYRVSLTGVDQHTELVLQDEDGERLSTDPAREVLSTIQNQYNRQIE